MNEELYKKIDDLESKVDEIYKIAHTAKKMFIWSMLISLLLFIIPLIILVIMLPTIMGTFSNMYGGLL